jgi:hypothetical protein
MDINKLTQLRILLLDCSHQKVHVDDVLRELEGFENDIRKIKQRDLFVDSNHTLLSAIKFELEYLIKQHTGLTHSKLIRLRDKIFGSLLRNVQIINEKKRVTGLFNNFIKGITFFSNEIPYDTNQPAYHRKESCTKRGSKNTECLQSNSLSVRQQKKREIRNCYIERLIYDDIWTTIIHSSQDINHISWLEETKKAYEKCFPGNELFCKVEYTDNNIPYRLSIFDGENEEIYEKRYDTVMNEYVYPVDITKYLSNGSVIREQSYFDML